MTEGMGYGPPIIPGRIYKSPLNSAHNELSDLEGKAHISETKVLFSGMLLFRLTPAFANGLFKMQKTEEAASPASSVYLSERQSGHKRIEKI